MKKRGVAKPNSKLAYLKDLEKCISTWRTKGTNHEVIYPDFLNLNINDSLDSIVNQFDQPFGNPTVLLTSILTENVKEKVTVSLVGDGGDELFAGYPRHWALLQQEK